jgi:hypothetical protein
MKFMKYLTDDFEITPKPKQGYKRCSECKTERPLSDFLRKASLLQSRAWTKNPNAQKRLQYESRTCNACYNTHRLRAPDLCPEAYRKRLVSEGLNPLKIEARVNARRTRGAIQRKEKTYRTLLKNAMPELKPLMEEILNLERKLKNKLLHLQRFGEGQSAGAVFCAKYCALFDSVKQQLKFKAKTGQKLPADWRELIADVFVADLWKMFRDIAPAQKQRFAPFMEHLPRTPDAN